MGEQSRASVLNFGYLLGSVGVYQLSHIQIEPPDKCLFDGQQSPLHRFSRAKCRKYESDFHHLLDRPIAHALGLASTPAVTSTSRDSEDYPLSSRRQSTFKELAVTPSGEWIASLGRRRHRGDTQVNMFTPEPAIEILHGVPVVDPYRWLENRTSDATEEWLTHQRIIYDAYFSALLGIDILQQQVSAYLNIEIVDQPARLTNKYIYRRRKKNQEQACICEKDPIAGKERVLVDPRHLGPFASVTIHCVSRDGSLLAYELKQGGADAKAIHIVDTITDETLVDHLPTGYTRGFAFAPNRSGFYYCHETSSSLEEHTLRFHHFGRHSDEDRVLFRVRRDQYSRLLLTCDEHRLGCVYTYNLGAQPVIDFYVAPLDEDPRWKLVFASKRLPFRPFLCRGRILVMTHEGAPNGKIIEATEDGTESREIVPESSDRIKQFVLAGNTIYVSYWNTFKSTFHRWTLDGCYMGPVTLPTDGTIDLLPRLSASSESFFYTHQSFAVRPRIFQYSPETKQSTPLEVDPIPGEPRAHRIREVTYSSRDGTKIPMSLVMRTDLEIRGPHPIILTSYGGFGTSMTPRFSVLVSIMLEMGAIFALPSIRGGSEFGNAWHEAARGRNRQVAFDDFIAAASWLITEELTSPDKLAIFGGSNSGLLVGTAMTQRPDLFRAVLCIAPLLDMVRYELFDQARRWKHEYGTVDDPQDFAALYAYSPYHRIREDINYPATLFVSGDMDDRCNPAHARKMACRLQDREVQQNPILLDYSHERGHSPVLPLSVRIRSLTRRIAFLCKELGISLPGGVTQ